MGRILTCLAIVCAMVYGVPVYGASECYSFTTHAHCITSYSDQIQVAEDIPCIWMPYDYSSGICAKPCHLRSKDECTGYNSGNSEYNSFCKFTGGRCVPECGNIKNKDACNRNIGCVYNDSFHTCDGCDTGEYYITHIGSEQGWDTRLDLPTDIPVVGKGECKACGQSGSKKTESGFEYEYLTDASTGGINSCGWKTSSCRAGFGLLKPFECKSCEKGWTTSKTEMEYIPNGEYPERTYDFCDKQCPENHYCDGVNGQQPCPNGTTSNAGATSKADCKLIITSDTKFCDKHGCFTLPLKEPLYHIE